MSTTLPSYTVIYCNFIVTYRTLHLFLGAFPFSIGCYAVYMNLENLWQEPPARFNPLQNFINGCLAAGVAQTLSYPFETVKRKMQVGYQSTLHMWAKISENETNHFEKEEIRV